MLRSYRLSENEMRSRDGGLVELTFEIFNVYVRVCACVCGIFSSNDDDRWASSWQ